MNDGSKKNRPVIEMDSDEAKAFFLKPESYFSFDLPPYFSFKQLLQIVTTYLEGKDLSDIRKSETKPKDCEGVNHILLSNKDGKHAWRPFELMHPTIYCHLVNKITQEESWEVIVKRFEEFKSQNSVECMSIPVESLGKMTDKEEQILNWWSDVEQKSIELALDYEVLAHTDIADCYGQIYTHSIAWALHSKEIAKVRRNDMSLIGNVIDKNIQNMRYSQTNGIPQGSILMDFVAEMVLGYADLLLDEKLQNTVLKSGKDYKILRYRDDYRIFTHSKYDAEMILKALTEVLLELGLKVNSSKTVLSENIITGSIKPDKLEWIYRKQSDKNLEKHFLIIHDHGLKNPNSGSLLRGLVELNQKIDNIKKYSNPQVLISIVTDIALHNPRTYPICAAIISRLLTLLQDKQLKQIIINRIIRKFSHIPNTGYLEIWLQRIALPLRLELDLKEPLCKIAAKETTISPWNNDWIEPDELQNIMKTSILDEKALEELEPIIPRKEVVLFLREY